MNAIIKALVKVSKNKLFELLNILRSSIMIGRYLCPSVLEESKC